MNIIFSLLHRRSEAFHDPGHASTKLKKIFGEMHMVSSITDAIRHNCEGYQPELPSQLDHKCLEENVLTHLNIYWVEVLETL